MNDKASLIHINKLVRNMYIQIAQVTPTGFVDLDRFFLGGLSSSCVTLIAGRPEMGKTSFAISIACNVAKITRKAVVYFSLDMAGSKIITRMVSSQSNTSLKGLLNNRIRINSWNSIKESIEELCNVNLFICDRVIKTSEILAICKGVTNLGLIVIDSFQSIPANESFQENCKKKNEVLIRDIESMAQVLNVPVIVTSNIPRENSKRKDMRPSIFDYDNTFFKVIEAYSDIVIFLYREYYYNNNDDINPNLLECLVAKNRIGDCGRSLLWWDSESLSVRDLPERRV